MRLFVRSHLGSTTCLSVEPTDSVSSLKRKLEEVVHIPSTQQRVSLRGINLNDSCLLSDYDVSDLCYLDVNCELLGGGKKRKKKAYTTPKKIKHKRKKVKLAALKFYKVDSNGKLTRLRRECPSTSCGAGIFMASHFDRQYCGKCFLTFMQPRE